jgi:DNA-binding FadR family transcriptional regulator
MPEVFNMTVNEYMPLRDVVFYTLRQAILKGEMAPGERLMEIQLAKKLGVRVRASNQNAYAARTELRKQVLDWSSNPYRL